MFFPFINPWSGIDPENMPEIELSEKGAKVLGIIGIVMLIALIALLIYVFCFFFSA